MSKRKESETSVGLAENSVIPPISKKAKIETKPKIELEETFADPTYDYTFKLLFGTDDNKDLLISVLNSLLNFKGEREIKEVEINANDFPIDGVGNIQSSVDVLCTTKNNQRIAVEMQRHYKDYFLPRSQEYMAKLIAGQVKNGDGAKYHEVLMDIYVLCIGKQNIFRSIKDDKLYEKTVIPMIQEYNREVPGNKMHWKFYELPRFKKCFKGKKIDIQNTLKEQWLDFLVKCHEQKTIPDDINELIKKGYKIMKVANWTEDQRILYWKHKSNEQLDLVESERIKEEKFNEGKKEGIIEGFVKGEKKGIIKGIVKGKKEGLVKGEIKQILNAKDWGISINKVLNSLEYLTKEYAEKIFNLTEENSTNNDPEEIYNSLYGQNNTDISLEENSEGSSDSEGMLSIEQ